MLAEYLSRPGSRPQGGWSYSPRDEAQLGGQDTHPALAGQIELVADVAYMGLQLSYTWSFGLAEQWARRKATLGRIEWLYFCSGELPRKQKQGGEALLDAGV